MSTTRELELFARYPWSESAANYIRDQHLELDTLVDASNRQVLEFAVQRILKAINSKDRHPEKSTNFNEICISFPVARMLIELLHDDALRHRFAVRQLFQGGCYSPALERGIGTEHRLSLIQADMVRS